MPDSRIMGVSMRSGAHKLVVSGLIAVLIASIAAPGLTLHNCKQFGTRSTQLCSCCETEMESSRGCCSPKTESAPQIVNAETVLESACCFTSVERPFSFDGQGSLQVKVSTPTQHELAVALPSTSNQSTPILDRMLVTSTLCARHSSDPPAYILTHSFRC